MNLQQLGEFGLIDAIARKAPCAKDVMRGIGDDAAVLNYTASKYLLLATDMIARGVHFNNAAPAQAIGHKALACNISDIAAMGGIPKHAVVSIGLPKQTTVQTVKDIYNGINALARRFDVNIVGGDTIASDQLIINIALLGEVEKKNVLLRSAAKSGDWIFVTGALGRAWKTSKHLSFTPRLRESRFLVGEFKLHAMIDISDGLAADIGHILKQSSVGAMLVEESIPLNHGAQLENALYDGEDYELLFSIPPGEAGRLIAWQEKNRRWFFYPIGRIETKRGLRLLDRDGRVKVISDRGHQHFSK